MTFAVCNIFTVCAHNKELLCQVLNKKHTANYRTHGKEPVSGSTVGLYNLDQPLIFPLNTRLRSSLTYSRKEIQRVTCP